jgi:hypothetical protein
MKQSAGECIVEEGDCLSTIAEATGHFWQTLWDLPDNAALKEARGAPNTLVAGDRVVIPPLRPRVVACRTGAVHRFRRLGVPAFLRLRFFWGGKPRANEPYTLKLEQRVIDGTTDAEGRVAVALPRDSYRGTIVVGTGESRQEFALQLGMLPPVTEVLGLRRRLRNLGYGVAEDDSDESLRRAVMAFQSANGLAADGENTPALQAKVVELHGG